MLRLKFNHVSERATDLFSKFIAVVIYHDLGLFQYVYDTR